MPPALLEQLLTELSTLASVYHKPPESFVGKGRFGTDEIQRAAIQEQRQNAAENPIAAAVGPSSTANGPPQNNVENLLDIDFDGAAPASQEAAGESSSGGGMADMMGLFDAPAPAGGVSAPGSVASPPPPAGPGGAMDDLMNGFGGLQMGGESETQGQGQGQPQGQAPKKDNEDLLGLF